MNVFKSIVVWFTGLSFMVVLFPLTLVIWLLALPFDRHRVVTHWFLIFQSPILPVLIDGTGGIPPRHGLLFSSGHHIRIRVLDPVHPSSFPNDTPEELAIKLSSLMKGELKELRTKVEVQ